MKKSYLLLALFFAFAQNLIAQVNDNDPVHHRFNISALQSRTQTSPQSSQSPLSTGTSGTGANIDVLYHKIFWRINPDSTKYIRGSVQTNFKTIVGSVSSINFDLRSTLTIDSVYFRGAKLPGASITRTGNTFAIALGTTLANNFIDSVIVYYRGAPPAVSGAAQGYQIGNDAGAGNYVNTLSESYEDRDWWPCKADMQDKIDSMDITVSVPWASPAAGDTFWVASNGKLVDSTISGTSRLFTYKTRYPIASYLVAVTVARFTRYYRTPVNINGTLVPVVYYLFRGKTAGTYNTILTAMDNMRMALDSLSDRYGDYGFKNEKHGFYEGLQGAAGMEHQTFSAIATGSISSNSVLAHELAHQWFGDKVSFATWNDLWLAEGFARYSESLVGEMVPSTGINPLTKRTSSKTTAQGIPTTPVRLSDADQATSNLIWTAANDDAVYEKGAMVVGMLRALLGDAKFFTALRNYQTAPGLAYKSATTDSLRIYMSQQAGLDMTNFFDDWVIKVGHPTTTINWNTPVAKKFVVSVGGQTRTGVPPAVTAYFRNVIALNVKDATHDTTIIIYDQGSGNLSKAGNGIDPATPGNLLSFDLSFTPTWVAFDSLKQTLSNGSTAKVGTLAVKVIDFSARKNGAVNDVNITLATNDPITKIEVLKSNNGANFTVAGEMTLAAAGLNPTYRFTDAVPYNPATFYRAKVYSATADVDYTQIVKVQSGIIKGITVSPNPATNEVKINFDNAARSKTTVRILASDGKEVISSTTNNGFVRFDISTLASGNYKVQVILDGTIAETVSLLKRQ
jgi:aminopeptidase N